MARVLALLVLLAAIVLPAAAGAADFNCPQQAFDLSSCTDPTDLDTCPSICTDPSDPATCATLPLPELASLVRQSPTQPILRQLVVLEGPHTNVSLSMVTLTASADSTFTNARNLLCAPPPPTSPPADDSESTPPPTGDGFGFGGGNPGLVGGNPGLVGPNPGLIGPNPGISIQR